MLSHNHIFQSLDGIAGCPACESIDAYHMTMIYLKVAWQQYLNGWA
jgi:hypothetical protein